MENSIINTSKLLVPSTSLSSVLEYALFPFSPSFEMFFFSFPVYIQIFGAEVYNLLCRIPIPLDKRETSPYV